MNPTFACRQLHTSSVKLLPPAPYSSTGWSSYPSAELSPSADELVQLAVRSFKASQQQWWFPSKHHIGNSDSAGDSEWLSCQGMESGVGWPAGSWCHPCYAIPTSESELQLSIISIPSFVPPTSFQLSLCSVPHVSEKNRKLMLLMELGVAFPTALKDTIHFMQWASISLTHYRCQGQKKQTFICKDQW